MGINIGTLSRYRAYSSPWAMIRSFSSHRIAINMYAVVMMANNRCAPVIVGVNQNAIIHPT